MGYVNAKVAVYCTVSDVHKASEDAAFESDFEFIERHLEVDKVYLETHRGMRWVKRDEVHKLKDFFANKGIATAGGFTPDMAGDWDFLPFCFNLF